MIIDAADPVEDLDAFRSATGLYTASVISPFWCEPGPLPQCLGVYPNTYAAGYYALIELEEGVHVINFGSEVNIPGVGLVSLLTSPQP